MRNWKDKIDRIFSAVTFAEAGEHETAMQMIGAEPAPKLSFNDLMTAITFAEAGEHETALEYMGGSRRRSALKSAGLSDFLTSVGLGEAKVHLVMATV